MDTPLIYLRVPHPWSSSLERRKRAPRIGEDNVEVYQEKLGLSAGEIERLRSTHAI
jgi:crotonobetainyl-CoA:carnitine CoA-transferase CaiB-like acyl-CoA transferase